MAPNRELVKKFEALGVDAPESWASSQESEGIDQLSRATVLSALADSVISSCLQGKQPEFLRGSDIGKKVWDLTTRSGIEPELVRELCAAAFASGVEQSLLHLGGAVELINNPDNIEVFIGKVDLETGEVAPLESLNESFWELLSHKSGKQF